MSKLLDYPLTEAKPSTVDGEHKQEAIEMTPAKPGVVNTISVEEVKKEVKKVKQCECVPDTSVHPDEYEVENIRAISGELLTKLKCGDVVVKITVEGGKTLKHTYIVTHKQATGICLSYFAAGYIETVSYDKVGNTWTYNSTDYWNASDTPAPSGSGTNIVTISNVDSAQTSIQGTITQAEHAKLIDSSKDCIVLLELDSGTTMQCHRTAFASALNIAYFCCRQYADADGNYKVYQVTFAKVGDDYKYMISVWEEDIYTAPANE